MPGPGGGRPRTTACSGRVADEVQRSYALDTESGAEIVDTGEEPVGVEPDRGRVHLLDGEGRGVDVDDRRRRRESRHETADAVLDLDLQSLGARVAEMGRIPAARDAEPTCQVCARKHLDARMVSEQVEEPRAADASGTDQQQDRFDRTPRRVTTSTGESALALLSVEARRLSE